MAQNKTYFVGEKASQTGEYVCSPCGYRLFLKKGELFPECVSCLESQKDISREDLTDEGVWEKV